MKPHNEEKTIQPHLLYEGRVIDVYRDEVELPNGEPAIREYVAHRGGAAILPIDEDGNVYLVRQFRYPYRTELLEIPAGKLEAGEDASEAARRELEEETGWICDNLRPYGVLYPSPGYTNEHLYIYLAEDLKKGHVHLDADEFVNVEVLPFDEVVRMVTDNTITDAKTCYAVLRYLADHR